MRKMKFEQKRTFSTMVKGRKKVINKTTIEGNVQNESNSE